jgi:hypothetical protein
MSTIFNLILGYLLLDIIILTISYTSVHFIKPRWEEWWERWIAAPHPDESGLGEDFPLI